MKRTVMTLAVAAQMLLGGLAYARDNMDMIRADYYFTHLAFYKAIPYYEKLAENGGTAYLYSRLGDCYRLTGDIVKAEDYYHKVIGMKKVTDPLRLKYGKVLMQLQQYDSASRWLKEFAATNPRDRRAANLVEGCKIAPGMLKAPNKGTPAFLDVNTDHSEFGPSFWNGNLVFASDTAVGISKRQSAWSGNACYNLYAIPCDGSGNCGSDVVTVGTAGKVNIEWHNGPATFNATGDTMYFTRTRYNEKFFARGAVPNKDSVVVLEIMMATEYDDATQRFTKVKPMAFNRQSHSVAHPTISADGNTMIFSSTASGNGSDMYMSHRNKKGKWMKPVNLGVNVNTEGEEVFPYLVNDTTLIFASDGHPGMGGLDIYVSHWDREKKVFLPPVNFGAPVNSSYDDISMALSVEGSGYFSSNRPAAMGSDNLYYYKKD